MRPRRYQKPCAVVRRCILVARAVGVAAAIGGYLSLRGFCPFAGMRRSYDILTFGAIGSLVGAASAVVAIRRKHTCVPYRWACHSFVLILFVAALYCADRWANTGLSVRLYTIALVATYESGAPGISFVQRSFFSLLAFLGVLAHAHLFTENRITSASLESVTAGIATALVVLGTAYRPRRSQADLKRKCYVGGFRNWMT
jgi:hypothetical protein